MPSNEEKQKAQEEMEIEENEEMKERDLIRKCEDRICKTVAAYRSSYRLMGRTNTGFNIAKGVFVSTAFAAVIPAVPVAVALVPIASAIIEIIQNATSLAKKRDTYKTLYKQYYNLLVLIRCRGAGVDMTKLLKYVEAKVNEIIEQDIYSPPLDRYMTKYKLDKRDLET
ncbi:uncharacterized protein LOC144451077 [Glandiceps talaboti]